MTARPDSTGTHDNHRPGPGERSSLPTSQHVRFTQAAGRNTVARSCQRPVYRGIWSQCVRIYSNRPDEIEEHHKRLRPRASFSAEMECWLSHTLRTVCTSCLMYRRWNTRMQHHRRPGEERERKRERERECVCERESERSRDRHQHT